MDQKTLHKVLRAYGLEVKRVLPAQKGYRNSSFPVDCGDSQANLILYKNEPGIAKTIQAANSVSNYLAEQGLPCRRTRDDRILQLKGERQTRYCSLYDYLLGETIPWEAYTMDHIKLLGKTMAQMHKLLADYPLASELPSALEQCRQLQVRMSVYFADQGVTDALKNKLGMAIKPGGLTHLQTTLDQLSTFNNFQALHMDFVRGNILFTDHPGLDITGILDFEKTAYGPRVLDVARTLAFLLVDCKYKSPQKTFKYFLKSGYVKRGENPLTEPELNILPGLLHFFLVHDLYKFLRHNPYESLPGNEHFQRTRQLLGL